MNARTIAVSTLIAASLMAEPALAHHVMDGRLPVTFTDGLLSGLGHPVIGLDHFAAVVAVGCLAGAHRAGAVLAIGYVLAMMAGVAAHLAGTGLPGAEILVALSVIGLGALMFANRQMNPFVALALFVVVGLLHGYVMGESIYGAEPAPLYAYFIGLAVIQSAIALAAMSIARMPLRSTVEVPPLRLIGAGIAGIGLALLVQQVIPAA